MIRIGIVGLSVHSEAFAAIINSEKEKYKGSKVVALYEPPVNPDVAFSTEQLSRFKSSILESGVDIVDSMDALLERSDAIMVLSNDGRPHLRETLPALKTKKPVYIDKPLAENFEGVQAIFKASTDWNVPLFSCSALRYIDGFQSEINTGKVGQILGGETYGPAPLQEAHVDLFWDGIHGVELLYTIMGRGCQYVQQIMKKDEEVVIGSWEDGRIGIFRGIRKGRAGFGGRAFGTEGIHRMEKFGGYGPLVEEIVKFFKTGVSPIAPEETIEIYAFMEAASRSKNDGGRKVALADITESSCNHCSTSISKP